MVSISDTEMLFLNSFQSLRRAKLLLLCKLVVVVYVNFTMELSSTIVNFCNMSECSSL